jgi:hypothetical protein
MAKSRGADAVYEALAALKGQPASAQVRTQIAAALAHKSNVIVARAAELAGQFKFVELCSNLAEAFERFSRDPHFPDGGCIARTALARAALEIQSPAERLFLSGIRQPGESAADLRSLCALGLVQVRYNGVMGELVDLLMDAELAARIGAVRALGNTGREDAAAVLRLKVLTGDLDSDVIGECFIAMLQLDAARSMPFVERYLDTDEDAIRDGAALAIGASRHPTAAAVLCRHFTPAIARDFRPTLFLAIATCRTAEAIDFLVGVARDKPAAIGAQAIAALALYRHDKTLRNRLQQLLKDCRSDVLDREYADQFGTNAENGGI